MYMHGILIDTNSEAPFDAYALSAYSAYARCYAYVSMSIVRHRADKLWRNRLAKRSSAAAPERA